MRTGKNLLQGNLTHTSTSNDDDISDNKTSFGSRAADYVTDAYGSWRAVFVYVIVLVAWVALNSYTIHAFSHEVPHIDPYPFTFLNLLLAIVGAVTPIFILMSQNQSASRDKALLEMTANSSVLAQSNLSFLSDELFAIRANQNKILNNQNKILVYFTRYSGSTAPVSNTSSQSQFSSGTTKSI